MALLKFMYTNTLSATTFSDMVDVLMALTNFRLNPVSNTAYNCYQKCPCALESALYYLEIPSTVLVIQPLKDASEKYLVAHFNDSEKSKEKAMELPLDALKIVLGSEGLRVDSEDDVYEFILEWARVHYPKLEERKEIINKQLARLICFPYMSCDMLRKVLVCCDFRGEEVSKLVTEALFGKAEDPSKYFATSRTRRLYKCRLVKVVPVEYSLPRCIIYFNLKKQECMDLFPSNFISSESFLVGRDWFYIGAECQAEESEETFGVYTCVDAGSETCKCTLDIEWSKKPSNEYEIQESVKNCIIAEVDRVGWWDLFEIPWATFISNESDYFIDDVLHLRADLTVKNPQP